MIQQILQHYLIEQHELYSKVCKVDSVNGMSCDCTPIDGTAPVKDVRLTAHFDNAERWVLVPKQGSFVVVSWLNKDTAFVSLVNAIDKLYYKIGDTLLQVDEEFLFEKGDTKFRIDDKFLLKNTAEDMLTLMKDLLDAMIQEKHMTNSGPTISLTPDSVTAYNLLKTRFEALLKSS